MKKTKIVMGLDPGIGNTGCAVVERTLTDYILLNSGYTETSTKASLGDRLDSQFITVHDWLMAYKPDLLAIEAIYFNRNVKSCISTAHVIGVAELAAYRLEIPTLQIKPQDVKQAVGCRGNADKSQIKMMVNKIVKTPIKNHHEADAVAVAIAGLLKYNPYNLKGKNT